MYIIFYTTGLEAHYGFVIEELDNILDLFTDDLYRRPSNFNSVILGLVVQFDFPLQ